MRPAVGHLAQVLAHRLVALFAALAGAQVVDRQVARDPVDPGVGAPAVVELVPVLPDLEEGHLHHVARLFGVGEDALAELDERLGLAADQLVERRLLSLAYGHQEVAVGRLGPRRALGEGLAVGVDELEHSHRVIRRRPRKPSMQGRPHPQGGHAGPPLRLSKQAIILPPRCDLSSGGSTSSRPGPRWPWQALSCSPGGGGITFPRCRAGWAAAAAGPRRGDRPARRPLAPRRLRGRGRRGGHPGAGAAAGRPPPRHHRHPHGPGTGQESS